MRTCAGVRSTWVFPFLLALGMPAQGSFPEGEAAIGAVLLQFESEGAADVFPVWRDLHRALSKEVAVVIGHRAGQGAGARDLAASAGLVSRSLEFVPVPKASTVWARDRVLVLATTEGRGYVFVTPRPGAVAEDRAGDLDVAALSVFGAGRSLATSLEFEGGNILCSSRRMFVGIDFVAQNSGMSSGAGVGLSQLRTLLGRELLVLGRSGVPHEHLDMFVTSVGADTVLLADPRAGLRWLRSKRALGLDLLPDFDEWTPDATAETISMIDQIHDELRSAGLRVVRLPWIRGAAGGVLTWNNALVERTERGARAYVPVYGIPDLDDRALAIYREVGFESLPIDVSRIAPSGGTVRCLTNVLRWRVVPGVQPRNCRLSKP